MSKQDRTYTRTPADLERKYGFGQTFAEVYDLVADAQKAANEANAAVDTLNNTLTPKEIFNRLTEYGKLDGVFRDVDDHIYINASYIKGEILEGDDLKVAAANITGKLTASQIDATNLSVDAANITGSLKAGSVETFMANVTGEFIASKITAGVLDAKILTVNAAKITGVLDAEHIDTDSLSVNAANITGTISASQIDADSLYVNAANITGDLMATNLYIDGALDVYGGGFPVGGLGYVSGEGPSGMTEGVGMVDAYGTHSVVVTDGGAKLMSDNCEIITAYNITLKSNNAINANKSITVTSDRRAKDNINYDVADYLPVFDALMPSTFVWKDGNDKRKHFGMIAQDVEDNVRSHDIPLENFAPLTIHEDGTYGLIYEEFVPLLIAKVQRMDAEIKELKNNG